MLFLSYSLSVQTYAGSLVDCIVENASEDSLHVNVPVLRRMAAATSKLRAHPAHSKETQKVKSFLVCGFVTVYSYLLMGLSLFANVVTIVVGGDDGDDDGDDVVSNVIVSSHHRH